MSVQPRTITLADGRALEYVASGADDGPVVVFHVGTPNAAAVFRDISEPAAALGLRVVSLSRPGYGGSDPQPGRTVADVAGDVAALLDALGIGEFLTLGWSGGGPHALACAALLPGRCRAAACIASVAPYGATGLDFLDGMDGANVAEFSAAIAGRAPLEAEIERELPGLAAIQPAAIREALGGLIGEVDAAALGGPLADDMAVALRRSVAQGIAGWRDDDLAFVAHWGFDVADIAVPVALWHGQKDRMVPYAHAEWLAAAIPAAEAHLFQDEGHLSFVAQAPAILSGLVRLGTTRSEPDYGAFDVLTFDCYGTLIDWESGIIAALRRALGGAAAGLADEQLLERFAALEHDAEADGARYRDVLARCLRGIAGQLDVEVADDDVATFAGSVGDWPAFPDSAAALERLHQRYRLVPITNCDDDLFAESEKRLVPFDLVVTAQQVGRYKPDPAGFHVAHERIERELGVPRTRVLHVAQSLFHDHVPAKALGMTTVWIDRRAGRPGGATPPADATPDARFETLAAFAARALD